MVTHGISPFRDRGHKELCQKNTRKFGHKAICAFSRLNGWYFFRFSRENLAGIVAQGKHMFFFRLMWL